MRPSNSAANGARHRVVECATTCWHRLCWDSQCPELPCACLTWQVVRRARLYETAPAHVENQPKFLNTAIAARTSLPPDQLLAALKTVEVSLHAIVAAAAA